ncbi:hypothetical protein RCL1_007813 [Eukaryota sp. TZLM3-RCL]
MSTCYTTQLSARKTARNSKIVATLGPSSYDLIPKLLQRGVSAFRLNMSHGSHEAHAKAYNVIRNASVGPYLCTVVISDLQGYKTRIALFEQGKVTIQPGQTFRFTKDLSPGTSERVGLPHPEVFAAFMENPSNEHFVLLDDGKVRLDVVSVTDDEIVCISEHGGELSDRKGISLPTVKLNISTITEKDRTDLAFSVELQVDYICLSFVQCPEDVLEARNLIDQHASKLGLRAPKIISKIETVAALHTIEAIVEASDGLMVARGDLGVALPFWEVPVVQKHLLSLCREHGKPSIVATHCLESMITNTRPTRSEVNDVASHVFDSSCSIMMSGETASGMFPLESTTAMDAIIRSTEEYLRKPGSDRAPQVVSIKSDLDAIADSARRCAQSLGCKAIVNFTETGYSSFRLSRCRPGIPIISTSSHVDVLRQLNIVYGIHPVLTNGVNHFEELPAAAANIALGTGFVSKGDKIIVVFGSPFNQSGTTSSMLIKTV